MDVVAVVALARSVDDEAPRLAADLGLTVFETAVMLRGSPPVVVFRSEDQNRAADVASRLRSRGHDVVHCDLNMVVSSDTMFRPRSFRFEGSDFVGVGSGVEQRLPLAAIFAMLRAHHATRSEDTVTSREHRLSFSRATMTGGLMMSKVHTQETRRVTLERENVLYVFRVDGPPWLLCSMQMRYDGLGSAMRPSRLENFDVLQQTLRDLAPSAPFDKRLLQVRVATNTIVTEGPGHLTQSSSGQIDVMAHILTLSLARATNPYR